jgi:hypothetical protein
MTMMCVEGWRLSPRLSGRRTGRVSHCLWSDDEVYVYPFIHFELCGFKFFKTGWSIMRWSYKTVHYELKKEGILGSAFLDEPEIELSLNQYGKAGWELVSLLETMDGLIAVFKQPLDVEIRSCSSSSKSPVTISRSPRVLEEQTPAVRPTAGKKIEVPIHGNEVVEAILLDEFDVVEDNVDSDAVGPAKPVDIGLIRIE